MNLALEDLASVKHEAVRSGLGIAVDPASAAAPMGFLDAPVDQFEEKGEVIWAEELIQMLCTEIDGAPCTFYDISTAKVCGTACSVSRPHQFVPPLCVSYFLDAINDDDNNNRPSPHDPRA